MQLAANNVSYSVTSLNKRLDILPSISCAIPAHSSIAITGPSGSGKSSLLAILAGLELPSSGEVLWSDKVINQLSEQQRAYLRLHNTSFVFQNFLLLPYLTALENIMLVLKLKGEKNYKNRAQEVLAQVGLKDKLKVAVNKLSGGEQQRVAIARAYVCKPKLLFADEPTGNLDQVTAATVTELLFDLHLNHGSSLIIVTHNQLLAQKCDQQINLTAI